MYKRQGIERKGRLEFIEKKKENKKVVIVELTAELELELDRYIREIEMLLVQEQVPEAISKPKCKKCAYYEYCYV